MARGLGRPGREGKIGRGAAGRETRQPSEGRISSRENVGSRRHLPYVECGYSGEDWLVSTNVQGTRRGNGREGIARKKVASAQASLALLFATRFDRPEHRMPARAHPRLKRAALLHRTPSRQPFPTSFPHFQAPLLSGSRDGFIRRQDIHEIRRGARRKACKGHRCQGPQRDRVRPRRKAPRSPLRD